MILVFEIDACFFSNKRAPQCLLWRVVSRDPGKGGAVEDKLRVEETSIT
jgi:hypothetical protein